MKPEAEMGKSGNAGKTSEGTGVDSNLEHIESGRGRGCFMLRDCLAKISLVLHGPKKYEKNNDCCSCAASDDQRR